MINPPTAKKSVYYAVNIYPEVSGEDTSFDAPDSSQPLEELHVYQDKAKAIEVLKKKKGAARMNVFNSKEKAVEFAHSPQSSKLVSSGHGDTLITENPQTSGPNEKPNEFRSLPITSLTKFGRMIQKGELETIKKLIWENPRHIISSVDTPEILQMGARYNALHLSARHNHPQVCSLLLELLQDPQFASLVYPNDSNRSMRMTHILDLYLNTPDKLNQDTPLHFACKWGHIDVAKILTIQPALDRNAKNIDKKTAKEVICGRCANKSQALEERIAELLEGPYYVPVLRSESSASIGQPWSPSHGSSQLQEPLEPSQSNPSSPHVKALAGPMSPAKAQEFHHRLKSSSPGLTSQQSLQIRRTDSEKGLERIARTLAKDMAVPWSEYWEFLERSADLTSEPGLQQLEDHLSTQARAQGHRERLGLPPAVSATPQRSGGVGPAEAGERVRLTPLVQQFQRMSIRNREGDSSVVKQLVSYLDESDDLLGEDPGGQGSGDSHDGMEPESHWRGGVLAGGEEYWLAEEDLPPTFDPEGERGGRESDSSEEEEEFLPAEEDLSIDPLAPHVFITGDEPSKSDLDVCNALEGVSIDWKFPYVRRWYKLIKSFTHLEKKSWSTPKLIRKARSQTR